MGKKQEKVTENKGVVEKKCFKSQTYLMSK